MKYNNNALEFLTASYIKQDSSYFQRSQETERNPEREPILPAGSGKPASGGRKSVSDILVELVVHIQNDNTKLDGFKKKLDAAIYTSAKSYGGIIRTTSLTDDISSILIMIEPGRFEELKTKISAMQGVKIIGEKQGHSIEMSAVDPFSGNNSISDSIHPYNCINVICD